MAYAAIHFDADDFEACGNRPCGCESVHRFSHRIELRTSRAADGHQDFFRGMRHKQTASIVIVLRRGFHTQMQGLRKTRSWSAGVWGPRNPSIGGNDLIGYGASARIWPLSELFAPGSDAYGRTNPNKVPAQKFESPSQVVRPALLRAGMMVRFWGGPNYVERN